MKWYSNLKLKYKISLMIGLLLTMLCIILCYLSITIFSSKYQEEAIELIKQWTNIASRTFNQNWQEIYDKILKTTVDKDFVISISDDNANYLQTKVQLQSAILSITQSSSLIESTYFITNDNIMYSSFDDNIVQYSDLVDYYTLNKSLADGITILKTENSPFKKNKRILPIIIPYVKLNGSSYLGIAKDNNPDFLLVVLLSTEKLAEKLDEASSDSFRSTKELSFNEENVFSTRDVENTSFSYTDETCINNLSLTLSVDIGSLMPIKGAVIFSYIVITAITIMLSIIALFLISNRLMAPFSKISRMLEEIKTNSYNFDVQAKYSDETGILITSINEMYSALLKNIELMKIEEKQKYEYHAQMLTEQINPHFIYNTLELINMEIINGNILSASEMVSCFALFLRSSLNQGNPIIEIKDELEQIKNYMKIMNARLNGNILLIINCDKSVENALIPKSILQPLIENSIKHGFENLKNNQEIILPAIRISITKKNDRILLIVSDNGKGIDIDIANKALENTKKSHVGLNNIATRIHIFDNSSTIEFSSIPFYQNEVIIDITCKYT